jgi:predicted nuclease with TOPRIM domain
MDGQVVTTKEEIDAMFSKVTAVFDHIRNVFLNESELSKRVEAMQAQINELSQQVGQVTANNSALQEAVNVLTQERDTARREWSETCEKLNSTETARAQAQSDADGWYHKWEELAQEHEKVKQERSALELDHQRLVEEYNKLQEQMKEVTTQLEAIYAMTRPKPVVEEVTDPLGPQPRDPETQRWQSWADRRSA